MYRPLRSDHRCRIGRGDSEKWVFGVDEEIDYGAKLSRAGLCSAELLFLKRPAEKGRRLHQILSNFVD